MKCVCVRVSVWNKGSSPPKIIYTYIIQIYILEEKIKKNFFSNIQISFCLQNDTFINRREEIIFVKRKKKIFSLEKNKQKKKINSITMKMTLKLGKFAVFTVDLIRFKGNSEWQISFDVRMFTWFLKELFSNNREINNSKLFTTQSKA